MNYLAGFSAPRPYYLSPKLQLMSRNDQLVERLHSSRRSVLKASGAATVASLLGVAGSAAAQEGDGDGGNGGGTNQDTTRGWMFNDEVRPGAVFRVKSLPLDERPSIADDAAQSLPQNPTTHIIEYFNTAEEATLILPSGTGVEQGELYQFDQSMQFVDGGAAEGLVQVQFQPLGEQGFPFDLADNNQVEVLDEGGEGAVRPRNFSGGSIFRVTSGPQGWVPNDVAQSGAFTSYNTRYAEYLGTDDEFLFFPQEDAEVQTDALYTVESEWELLDPAGNLVAVQFNRVREDSIPIDDQYL